MKQEKAAIMSYLEEFITRGRSESLRHDAMHDVLKNLWRVREKLQEAREKEIDRAQLLVGVDDTNEYQYVSGISTGLDDAVDMVTAQIALVLGDNLRKLPPNEDA